MPARTGLLPFVTLALACTSAAPLPPAPAPAPAPAAPEPAPTILTVTAPASEDPELTATIIDSGWGSVGPVALDAPIPYWVMTVLEVETTHEVSGLELVDVELFDATGVRLGHADRELELRLIPPGASLYGDAGLPFAGTITAGRRQRLRLRARMEDGFAERGTSVPTSHRIMLRSKAGAVIRVTGQVGGQWPTG